MSRTKTERLKVVGPDLLMPDVTLLSEYLESEKAVLVRWHANKATIGDLDNAGPHTKRLASMIMREISMAQASK